MSGTASYTRVGLRIDQLPPGTRIGTSAVRRVAQLALHWPSLVPVAIRGNANSRLAKLDAGDSYDALLLAYSGLERIGQAARITHPIGVDTMVRPSAPAPWCCSAGRTTPAPVTWRPASATAGPGGRPWPNGPCCTSCRATVTPPSPRSPAPNPTAASAYEQG
ncbi:hypothetical protein AB0C15_29265 [Micromonospora sp. NPDC048835]|uniref:hypothetical protein n=1 Tax=Micromonospora sp. NPDC048835 TaxID=3155147 RepID=UPI0033E9FA95